MSYTAKDLVVCKKAIAFDDNFRVGQVYRCSDNIVYGYPFNEKAFKENFDYLHDVVVAEWTKLGLIVDGKPVSKTAFKQWFDVHTYGRGKTALRVGYIGIPREVMYQFFPIERYTKKATLEKEAYNFFIEVIKGNVEAFDPIFTKIVRGNSGIPISYGQIYWR
jgi:hypothetical protein